MEESTVRSATGAGTRAATAGNVRQTFEEARCQFAALLQRCSDSRPLLAAAFQQLEACIAVSEQLEDRQWRRLRDRLAGRWRRRSEAACRPRLAQLASRRQLLAEQQRQLDGLLVESRRQLQLAAPPPTDVPSRLLRKWERLRLADPDAAARDQAERRQPAEAAAAAPPPPAGAVKPWRIEGLSLEEACDKRRLLERLRQLETDTARLAEQRDTQYRPVTDYSHCLRKYFSCVQKSKRSTNELMKVS